MKKLLLVVMSLAWMAQAQIINGEDVRSGETLLKRCLIANRASDGNVSDAEIIDGVMCLAYMRGYADAIVMQALTSKPISCPPESVSAQMLSRVVTKFLEAHPEKLHLDESVLVAKALREAYPCGAN
jgi:hypothetical protein